MERLSATIVLNIKNYYLLCKICKNDWAIKTQNGHLENANNQICLAKNALKIYNTLPDEIKTYNQSEFRVKCKCLEDRLVCLSFEYYHSSSGQER